MLGLTPSTFEEFEREAGRGNVVPVVRRVLADLQTPVGAFLRVAVGARHAFLLESVEGGERVARYSFLGAHPEMIVRGRGDMTAVTRRGGGTAEVMNLNAVEYLREYFRGLSRARDTGLAPLAGGAVGYLTYGAARWFEPSTGGAFAPDTDRDDALFMLFRTVLAFDRVRQLVEITTVVMTGEAGGVRERLRGLYEAAAAETGRIERMLAEPPQPQPALADVAEAGVPESDVVSGRERSDFEAAVERVKEHIAAGDCHRVVLSRPVSVRVGVAPLQVYRALRAANPSPYAYFLKLGDESVIGASHETLVRCRGQRLDCRPFSGERARGATEAEDWLLGEEMRSDETDAAEHALLVDLCRSDLGRVSDYGSVEVGEMSGVERYSRAQHLVSQLRGRLRDDRDRFDALAACFPAGAVTGSPRPRAMQLIAEIEPSARGVYGGAVLYADYADNLDSCVAAGTIHVRGGGAEVRAGAGVTAASVPARVFEEVLEKTRALTRAVELAGQGL